MSFLPSKFKNVSKSLTNWDICKAITYIKNKEKYESNRFILKKNIFIAFVFQCCSSGNVSCRQMILILVVFWGNIDKALETWFIEGCTEDGLLWPNTIDELNWVGSADVVAEVAQKMEFPKYTHYEIKALADRAKTGDRMSQMSCFGPNYISPKIKDLDDELLFHLLWECYGIFQKWLCFILLFFSESSRDDCKLQRIHVYSLRTLRFTHPRARIW